MNFMKNHWIIQFFLLIILTVSISADDVPPDLINARLVISAQFYFGDNDEEKMPFVADVYLLPASAVEILKKAGFQPQDENGLFLTDDDSYYSAFAQTFDRTDEENAILNLLLFEKIEHKKIVKLKTDAEGYTQATIKTGSYHLFTVKRHEDEIFLWNLPVLVSPGGSSVTLDQYNAGAVVEINR